MSLSITPQQAYADGKAMGQAALANETWFKMAESCMQWARIAYPCSADLDYKAECLKLEKERMSADLDLTRFPECKGLREAVAAQHQGFLDACGQEWMAAYQFNWYWFISRRLNTRFVGASAPKGHCTAVFFPDSAEGPLFGNNLDDIRRPFEKFEPPREGPSGEPIGKITQIGGVSSAVLCDEEPENIFPVNLDWIRPDDIRTLRDHVAFLERYGEFWGPFNSLWVDADLNSVAIEKSNCRMGVRWPENGVSAITACSYLTPEMNAFKKERDRVSIEKRGWTNDCPDYVYWDGCEQRYHRLLKLVADEARRGPTLHGLSTIMLDHAVPFPDRIAIAGERGHRDEQLQNWTLVSMSSVMFGPTRRMLWSRVEGQTPVYETKPFLAPGKGVAARTEWEEEERRGVYRIVR